MADTSVIGRASFVRGRVTGDGDLEIAGRVEGEIAVSGEVVVEATGLVAANIEGRRIIVRGAVKGDLVASELVSLEATARVVGDLRAPRIAIAQGGLVRGQVATSGGGAARPRAAQATAARAPARETARREEPRREEARREEPRRVVPAPAPSKAAPAKASPAKVESKANGPAPRGATIAGSRVGPPPPVVPVLKKGTKAVQKKR